MIFFVYSTIWYVGNGAALHKNLSSHGCQVSQLISRQEKLADVPAGAWNSGTAKTHLIHATMYLFAGAASSVYRNTRIKHLPLPTYHIHLSPLRRVTSNANSIAKPVLTRKKGCDTSSSLCPWYGAWWYLYFTGNRLGIRHAQASSRRWATNLDFCFL